jgi:hypothetical protein
LDDIWREKNAESGGDEDEGKGERPTDPIAVGHVVCLNLSLACQRRRSLDPPFPEPDISSLYRRYITLTHSPRL